MDTSDIETSIRWARAEDADDILRLIHGLAAYEHEPAETVKTTAADIRRDGFGPQPRFECLIAEHTGKVVGMALFFQNYSTWEGTAGIFLEDLFVEPDARGLGLGKALMAALARVAHERKCARLDLSVLDWNPTREFYHRMDFKHMNEWLSYRADADSIVRLAKDAPTISS